VTAVTWTDVHCHLADYADPEVVLAAASRAGVSVYTSTVLPSEYRRLSSEGAVGLGFHPMHADIPTRDEELAVYEAAFDEATWLSEIGLDGWMPQHAEHPSLTSQERLLERLFAPGVQGKVLSLHARSAERRCAEMVIAAQPRGAVFHWYKGDLDVARLIVEAGMLFSVNPMMIADPGRAEFLRWVPGDALLLETDGPQPDERGSATVSPSDLPVAAEVLARIRGIRVEDLGESMGANLARLTT